MKNLFLLLVFSCLLSCTRDVSISHEKTEESGLMTFVVDNPTEQDIRVIELGFRFLDANGEVIVADTVSYKMAAESPEQIFVKANDFTWVNQSPPDGTEEVEAFVVSYE